MKKITTVFIFLLTAYFGYAQQCGTTYSSEDLKKSNPDLYNKIYGENLEKDLPDNDPNKVYTIPVVVHIVYGTSEENLPDSTIIKGIEYLNRNFGGNQLWSQNIPWVWKNRNASDIKIRFKFATIDPNGNQTNGITRTYTCHGPFNYPSNSDDIFYTSNGGFNAWNPNKYLNIWVCNLTSVNGVAAYTLGLNNIGGTKDGIVVKYPFFGKFGTEAGTTTLTHECGHYLGLEHTFGLLQSCYDINNNNNVDDDGISDTPWESKSASSIVTNANQYVFPLIDDNACVPVVSNNGIMFMNFMDYYKEPAVSMFTVKQKQTMRNALQNGRSSLVANALSLTTPSYSNVHTEFQTWNQGTSYKCISVGLSGEIWTGTSGSGLFRWKQNTGWMQMPQYNNQYVRAITRDKNGRIYDGSAEYINAAVGGVNRYPIANSQSADAHWGSTISGDIGGLPSRYVNSLSVDTATNTIWAACMPHTIDAGGAIQEGGIGYLNNGNGVFNAIDISGQLGLPYDDLRCGSIGIVKEGVNNFVYFFVGNYTGSKLLKYEISTGNFFNIDLSSILPNFGAAGNQGIIRSIHQDGSGRIWLGFSLGGLDGIAVSNSTTIAGCSSQLTWNYYPYPSGMTSNFNAIKSDADGNVWIGTTNGLIKIKGGDINSPWTIYTTTQGLPSNNITGITFDYRGNIWCSTSNGIFRGLPCPSIKSATVTNASCNGGGAVEISLIGGDPAGSYWWEKDGNLFSNTQNLIGNGPGKYSFSVILPGNINACVKQEYFLSPNDIFLPKITLSNPQPCGFDINFEDNNPSNKYYYWVFNKMSATLSNEVLNNTQIGNATININNLIPHHTYFINAGVNCSSSIINLPITIVSQSKTIYTTTCPPPDNIQTNPGASSVFIEWTNSCSNADSYEVQIKPISGITNWVSVNSSVNYKTISGLSPSTLYKIRIRSNYCSSHTDWTSDFLFSTSRIESNICDNVLLIKNPISSKLIFNYSSNQELKSIIINNNFGQLIYSDKNPAASNGLFEINTADWPDGVYYLSINSNAGVINKKFIKVSEE